MEAHEFVKYHAEYQRNLLSDTHKLRELLRKQRVYHFFFTFTVRIDQRFGKHVAILTEYKLPQDREVCIASDCDLDFVIEIAMGVIYKLAMADERFNFN